MGCKEIGDGGMEGKWGETREGGMEDRRERGELQTLGMKKDMET